MTTASEATAQSNPFTYVVENRAQKGEWGPVFPLRNVAIHAHLLPDGRVLMWGRRDQPEGALDALGCTPFVWDPTSDQPGDDTTPQLALTASQSAWPAAFWRVLVPGDPDPTSA